MHFDSTLLLTQQISTTFSDTSTHGKWKHMRMADGHKYQHDMQQICVSYTSTNLCLTIYTHVMCTNMCHHTYNLSNYVCVHQIHTFNSSTSLSITYYHHHLTHTSFKKFHPITSIISNSIIITFIKFSSHTFINTLFLTTTHHIHHTITSIQNHSTNSNHTIHQTHIHIPFHQFNT